MWRECMEKIIKLVILFVFKVTGEKIYRSEIHIT